MPVTVQLPGYNRNVLGENIANIAGGVANAYSGYKKGQLEDTENQAAQQKMQIEGQSNKANQDYLKELQTPDSKASVLSGSALKMAIGGLDASGFIDKSPDGQQGKSALLSAINQKDDH